MTEDDDSFFNAKTVIDHMAKGRSMDRRIEKVESAAKAKRSRGGRGLKTERTAQWNIKIQTAVRETANSYAQKFDWTAAEYTERAFKMFNSHLDQILKIKGDKNA